MLQIAVHASCAYRVEFATNYDKFASDKFDIAYFACMSGFIFRFLKNETLLNTFNFHWIFNELVTFLPFIADIACFGVIRDKNMSIESVFVFQEEIHHLRF